MNLWHPPALSPPTPHFQTLIDSTWEEWFSFHVSWFRGLQRESSGQQTDKSKDKKYLSAWINWNVSENTFGIIFRNVRFGDDRTGTVFLTVLAHQSFRVQVRVTREKNSLLSAILEESTTQKRERLTCHLTLWQRCYKMPDCLINETHSLEHVH